jgi:hypothetical protein
MTIFLEEVTLVCLDTRNTLVAIESMSRSLSQAQFAKNILFTSKNLCSEDILHKAKVLNIKLVFIPEIKSITEYSYFILAKLDDYISTNFCLVTQWDSWIIDSTFWNQDYLNYDYIGAIWPHYSFNQIGNGGFSLRSKKLLKSSKKLIMSSTKFHTPLIEDDYICREKREIFEKNYQIKFPTNNIANKFSIERNGIPSKTFGFHGMFHFSFVIKKDEDLIKVINKLSDDCFIGSSSYDLIKSLLAEKRFNSAELIIKRRIKHNGLSTKNIKLYYFLLIEKFLK